MYCCIPGTSKYIRIHQVPGIQVPMDWSTRPNVRLRKGGIRDYRSVFDPAGRHIPPRYQRCECHRFCFKGRNWRTSIRWYGGIPSHELGLSYRIINVMYVCILLNKNSNQRLLRVLIFLWVKSFQSRWNKNPTTLANLSRSYLRTIQSPGSPSRSQKEIRWSRVRFPPLSHVLYMHIVHRSVFHFQ